LTGLEVRSWGKDERCGGARGYEKLIGPLVSFALYPPGCTDARTRGVCSDLTGVL